MIVGVVPVVTGLLVALNPLRRKSSAQADDAKFELESMKVQIDEARRRLADAGFANVERSWVNKAKNKTAVDCSLRIFVASKP